MTKREFANAKRLDAHAVDLAVDAHAIDAQSIDPQSIDAHLIDAQLIDEYAETQVLADRPGIAPRAADDDAAQSVYSEYVQEIERMLKAASGK
jgi:hypothetical protein